MAKRKKGSGLGQAVPYDDSKWRAERDHNTLTQAAEITGDKSRMKAVRGHHVDQTKALKKMDPLLGGNKIRGSQGYKGLMGALKGK